MPNRETGGVGSLPVVIILSVALGVLVLGLGVKALTRTQGLLEDQRAIESFNTLVEQAHAVSSGGIGTKRYFSLDLPNGEILVDGRLVQLEVGGEIRRSEVLPLPISGYGKGERIRSGSYSLTLVAYRFDDNATLVESLRLEEM